MAFALHRDTQHVKDIKRPGTSGTFEEKHVSLALRVMSYSPKLGTGITENNNK